MSFYFYSLKNGEISSLTGTKSIVICEDDTDLFQGKLRFDYSNHQELTKYYESLFEVSFNDTDINAQRREYLREEWSHYQYLSKSTTSNAFYLSNILLRLSYTSINNNFLEKIKNRHRRVDRQVIGYYRKYARFVTIALPLLEAAFRLDTQKVKCELQAYEDYDRLSLAYDKLKTFLSRNRTVKLIDFIPSFIDECFVLNRSFSDIKPTYLKRVHKFKIFRTLVLPIFRNPQIYPILFKSLTQNSPRLILKQTINKVFMTSGIKDFSKLPALEVGETTIDPAGFWASKPHMPSQEVELGEEDKYYSNLYWAILARVGSNLEVLRLSNGEFPLVEHYSRFRKFVYRWIKDTDSVEDQLSYFDERIIKNCRKMYLDNENCSNRDLVNTGKEVFREFRDIFHYSANNKAFNRVIGLYYLQI